MTKTMTASEALEAIVNDRLLVARPKDYKCVNNKMHFVGNNSGVLVPLVLNVSLRGTKVYSKSLERCGHSFNLKWFLPKVEWIVKTRMEVLSKSDLLTNGKEQDNL